MDTKELNYNRANNTKGALIGNWYEETVLKSSNPNQTFNRTMFNIYGREFETTNSQYGKMKENVYKDKIKPREHKLREMYLRHCDKKAKF